MRSKTIFLALTVLIAFSAVIVSCNREEPLEPIAEFTTNLENNTAYAGQSFYIYLDKAQGDFLTLFTGTSPSKVYSPDDGTRSGSTVDPSLDSFEVTTYNNAGLFRMTLVASSSGNWAEDYVQDTFGIDLTVIDARVGFSEFSINDVPGIYSEDGTTIIFTDHKNADLSALKPAFQTFSSNAIVTIDGVEQVSQVSEVDFSPTSPGADQGRPVTYTVTAPNGDSQDYVVQFNLREPSSEKVLFSLVTASFGNIVLSSENQANKEVIITYESGTNLTNVKTQASASAGAKVYMLNDDGEQEEISMDDERVDFLNSGVVTVEAEDGSTQDYTIKLYELESLETISFIEAGGSPLNPAVGGTIGEGVIDFTVLAGTDLTSLVAEFTGLTNGLLFLGGTELTSGVTVADYSGDPVLEIRAADGAVLNSYTVNISEASK